jgi:TfoX/Sxy family transcriptional regulator of competence genes
MCYYLLPEEILENREELEKWLEKSLLVETTTKKKTMKNIELDKKILSSLCDIPK